jgi:hypothetical protein
MKSLFRRPGGNLRTRVERQLGEDVLDVTLGRPSRDDQPRRDLAVRKPAGDQPRDFSFTRCQDALTPLARLPRRSWKQNALSGRQGIISGLVERHGPALRPGGGKRPILKRSTRSGRALVMVGLVAGSNLPAEGIA